MASAQVERTQVFLCYSHNDKRHADRLLAHLKIYRDRGLVEGWSDQDLQAGERWRTKIFEELERTKVAVLLFSVDFFDSDFIQHEELPRILAAARAGELTVLQVLVGECTYEATELEPYQFALSPARPVGFMGRAERDRAWKHVCKEVEKALHGPVQASSSSAPDGAAFSSLQAPIKRKEAEADAQTLGLTQERQRALWDRYRGKLKSDPHVAQMQILGMTRALPVTEIYVMVRLHEETRLSFHVDVEQQQARDPQFVAELQREHLEQRVSTALDPVEALCRPRNVSQKRFAIVGNPGAGKTTLLKRLAMLAIDDLLPLAPLLPIYVRLNEFANAGSDDLLVFILHTWQERYGLSEDEYRPFLLQYLEAGRALVLLDALDETAVGQSTEVAEESYLRVSRAILRFTTRFEQALFALTARKAGYHKRARLPGFSELEVLDFRIEEIAQFVHKWFRAYTPPAKHGLADRLLRELKMRVHLQSLAANPLLLSLIALDYEANLELPDDRARLYDECIEILLRRWDADRLIVRARAFRPEFQKQILPEIAWHFHLRGLRFFTRDELLPLIADFLKQKRIDPGEAAGVLADIVTENGLLREQAHEVYGFLHLTLQEYFAASYLSERHQLKRLLTYLGDPWWEEVILLYAGHTFDASPLLTHLLQSAGEGVAAEDIFFSKLLLAGRCLATHPRLSDPALYDQTCQRLLDLFAHASYTTLCRQAAAALVEIARSDPNGEVWQRMLEMLKSEEAEKPARVFSEEENLQHMLLTAIANLGGAELHRALLPPLLQGAFPERIAEGAATLLRALKDETIEQEVFLRLEDQRVALNMRAPLIHAVGSMDNPASIQRLLAFHNGLESDAHRSTLSSIEWHLHEIISDQGESDFLGVFLAPGMCTCFGKQSYISSIDEHLEGQTDLVTCLQSLAIDAVFAYRTEKEVYAFYHTADPRLKEYLPALLKNEALSKNVRYIFGCECIREMDAQSWESFVPLVPLLADPVLDVATVRAIIERSCEGDYPRMVPALLDLLQRRELTAVRDYVLGALIAQGQRQFLPDLLVSMKYTHGAAWFLARLLVRHVDPATLVPLCCEKGYPPRLRTAIIDELAQGGNSAFLSPFLTALEKRATLQEVRMALARALGYMARDEETVNRLLALYQGERSEEMRDALYTALYHICRRANVTIVPEGLLGSRLRVVKR